MEVEDVEEDVTDSSKSSSSTSKDKTAVKVSSHECVICGQVTESVEDKPIGLIVLLQPSTSKYSWVIQAEVWIWFRNNKDYKESFYLLGSVQFLYFIWIHICLCMNWIRSCKLIVTFEYNDNHICPLWKSYASLMTQKLSCLVVKCSLPLASLFSLSGLTYAVLRLASVPSTLTIYDYFSLSFKPAWCDFSGKQPSIWG